MKKILFAIIMLAISTVIMFGKSNTNSEEEKERIETVKKVFTGGLIPRSMDSYVIDAYLFLKTGEVEVSLFNTGESEVYIIDSTGQTVDYTSVITDIPSTIYLSTNGPGSYYLVIVSDTCYAEGYFTL